MASSNTAIIPPSRQSETNYTTFRDVSFSSYLNPSEENYIRNLVNNTTHNKLNNKKVDDEEIDVFSADKYFNGDVNNQIVEKHNEKTVINLSKLNLQPRTPSIYSESSSWNSQSGLLRTVQMNPSRSKYNIKVKNNIKSSFLSLCYCCNDKSIEIEFQDRLSSTNQGRDTSFDNNSSFRRESITRTIKTSFDTAEIARLNKLRPVVDPNPNPNLDPFTFPVSKPGLTWETIPRGTYIDDDTESDASSDLFEIECLSCTGNNPNNNGYGGCGTPTTRYEPSEVSVDWSVVTASAADCSEDQRSTLTSVTSSGGVGPKLRSTVKRVETKGGQKSRSGGLLGGCRSQKAVRVAEDVYRSPTVQNATRI
ncbi:protein PHYTOCHROME KINASE SUBSTRATE 1-like [Silene latifolia]|uniref:protein PHYTOCHROME KINASE SUBSTRATE 1-like n=1 Tax=Silene latifolia TaxID=37657 RepID=UPI003D773D8F